MQFNAFLAAILLLAAVPTIAISRHSATGWRAGVVFAAFYPALVLLIGILTVGTFLILAPLGIFNLD